MTKDFEDEKTQMKKFGDEKFGDEEFGDATMKVVDGDEGGTEEESMFEGEYKQIEHVVDEKFWR